MSAILRDEPARVTASQPALPTSLDYVVETCLARDPDHRWQNTRDVALALKGIAEAKASSTTRLKPRTTRRRERLAWVVGMIAVIALAALMVWGPWRRPPSCRKEASSDSPSRPLESPAMTMSACRPTGNASPLRPRDLMARRRSGYGRSRTAGCGRFPAPRKSRSDFSVARCGLDRLLCAGKTEEGQPDDRRHGNVVQCEQSARRQLGADNTIVFSPSAGQVSTSFRHPAVSRSR